MRHGTVHGSLMLYIVKFDRISGASLYLGKDIVEYEAGAAQRWTSRDQAWERTRAYMEQLVNCENVERVVTIPVLQ